MNRLSYYQGEWGGVSEILLEELRYRGVFLKGFSQEENRDASPYWYGTILDFERLEEQLPLVKESRRAEIVRIYKSCEVSPIVQLLGSTLERIWNR